MLVVVLFVVMAVGAPLLAPFDPNATSWSAIRKAPSALHWMGTDENGRDVLSRVLYGARASMVAGVFSALIAAAIGVPLGLIAGLVGGWTDSVTGRVTDAVLSVPFLILAIALAAFLGPSLQNAMIAIGIAAAPAFVRVARGAAIDIGTQDYVEAARAVGNQPWRVAVRHVLPNIVPPVLVQTTLAIAVVAEAGLSSPGLGPQPPAASWGSMLNSAQRFAFARNGQTASAEAFAQALTAAGVHADPSATVLCDGDAGLWRLQRETLPAATVCSTGGMSPFVLSTRCRRRAVSAPARRTQILRIRQFIAWSARNGACGRWTGVPAQARWSIPLDERRALTRDSRHPSSPATHERASRLPRA
jgi:peptide/nickel transport system permease protein